MTSQFLLIDGSSVRPMQSFGHLAQGIAEVSMMSQRRTDDAGIEFVDTYETGMGIFERRLDGYMSDLRTDGFDPGLGAFNPRDLTHRFRQVLEEKRAPLNATKVFPTNTEVPPGALKYEISRGYSSGEAIVYRGGSGADVQAVSIGNATMSANVVYLAAKMEISWLESMRGNMAGLDIQGRKMRAAAMTIDQLINRWTFQGSAENALLGLLNNPYVDTALSAVSYVAATAADDIVEDFCKWGFYATTESKGAFEADTLLISTKLYAKLSARRYGDNADKSLLDWVLGTLKHIKQVVPIHELDDAGGASVHGMALIRRGTGGDSSAEIVMTMTPTLLPGERRSLVTETFLVAGFGGLLQREVGDNLIVYVQSEA